MLEDQDRALWDATAIAEGHELVVAALSGGAAGPLRAAGGDRLAARPGAELRRDRLAADRHALRRAAAHLALARRRPQPRHRGLDERGPEAGLAALAALEADGRLAGYRYLPAAKADLLRRLGRGDEAAVAYRAALALADNDAERAFLERRLAECATPPERDLGG